MIDNKTREKAAIYCSAMAVYWAGSRLVESVVLRRSSARISALAYAARKATGIWPKPRSKKTESNRVHSEAWTAAEALLLAGWTP